MEVTGEYMIQAPRAQVWDALNDPDILRETLPGCEQFEQTGKNRYTARITSAVGPLKATFDYSIGLSHLNPPFSYTLSANGESDSAGSAAGCANVILDEDGPDTLLRYIADFSVDGKLAQLESGLITDALQRDAARFFTDFAGLVNAMAMLDVLDHDKAVLEKIEPPPPVTARQTSAMTAAGPQQSTPAPLADAGASSHAVSPSAGSSSAGASTTPAVAAGSGGSRSWLWLAIGSVILILLWLLLF